MPPVVRWRSLLAPKRGHSLAECEDAIAGDVATGRFAVADGASESYASGEWARLLVDGYVSSGTSPNWLNEPQARWQHEIGQRSSTWYAEEKFAAGAHAAFVGVQVSVEGDEARWGAEAIGDSCLFVMHGDRFESCFPMTQSRDFRRTPLLLNSRDPAPVWDFGMGVLTAGSRLLLASDALAHYLLASAEQHAFIGIDLLLLDEQSFPEWVEHARAMGLLRNDDVALGIVEFA